LNNLFPLDKIGLKKFVVRWYHDFVILYLYTLFSQCFFIDLYDDVYTGKVNKGKGSMLQT